jgi:hypothetical protein
VHCVGFLGKWERERERERERGVVKEGKKPSSLACSASRGRRWQTVPSKQQRFVFYNSE